MDITSQPVSINSIRDPRQQTLARMLNGNNKQIRDKTVANYDENLTSEDFIDETPESLSYKMRFAGMDRLAADQFLKDNGIAKSPELDTEMKAALTEKNPVQNRSPFKFAFTCSGDIPEKEIAGLMDMMHTYLGFVLANLTPEERSRLSDIRLPGLSAEVAVAACDLAKEMKISGDKRDYSRVYGNTVISRGGESGKCLTVLLDYKRVFCSEDPGQTLLSTLNHEITGHFPPIAQNIVPSSDNIAEFLAYAVSYVTLKRISDALARNGKRDLLTDIQVNGQEKIHKYWAAEISDWDTSFKDLDKGTVRPRP